MEQDPMDENEVDEIFSKMIMSDGMSEIAKQIDKELNLSIKDLVYLQESLGTVVSNVSNIIINKMNKEHKDNEEANEILFSLYKLCEDFNSVMIELYSEQYEIDEEEDDEDGNAD